jgi:hypothetical protein
MSTDNLGVSARMKYGFLLDKMGGRLPVFRTESQEWVKPPWVMGGWLIRLVGCSDPHRTSLPASSATPLTSNTTWKSRSSHLGSIILWLLGPL